MTSGIYKITNLITNQIYIGSAVDFIKRWMHHEYALNAGTHSNKYLQSAWNKYGAENFEFSAIEAVAKEYLIEREQYWIDLLKPFNKEIGYNLRPMAKNNLGIKFSDETKAKMSEMRKRENLSQETLDKFANRMKGNKYTKGIKLSDAHKKALYESRKGRLTSEETKAKISAAHKGKPRLSRKTDKWPHEKASRCRCEECKLKKNLALMLWRKQQFGNMVLQ